MATTEQEIEDAGCAIHKCRKNTLAYWKAVAAYQILRTRKAEEDTQRLYEKFASCNLIDVVNANQALFKDKENLLEQLRQCEEEHVQTVADLDKEIADLKEARDDLARAFGVDAFALAQAEITRRLPNGAWIL